MRDRRRQQLESFGRGPALLHGTLHMLPKKMWLYRPAPERWSIHEIILHLADSEASGYVQCRSLIAEPGTRALRPNAVRWANTLGYFHQSTREALELIRRLRKMTYQLLAKLPEPAWRCSMQNPDDTETDLEHWLEQQERHIPHHLEQMRENYESWLKVNPARSNPGLVRERAMEAAASQGISVSLGTR